MTSLRPTVCAECSKPLPIAASTGRPRRYCDDACRYAARRRRDDDRELGVAETVEPVELNIDRERIAASLALLVAPNREPAAPEDQLARMLLELRTVEGRLRALWPDLPPSLRGRAGRVANSVAGAIARAFPDV